MKSVALVLFGGLAGFALAAEDLVGKYLPLQAAPKHHRAIIDND